MSVFDDILRQVPEEKRTLFNEYPDIRRTVENLEASVADATNRVAQWENFLYGTPDERGVRQGGEFDPEAKDFRRNVETKRQLAEAQSRVAALEASLETGADMTFDEILEGLKAKGYPSKPEVQEIVKSVTGDLAARKEVEDANNRLAYGFQRVYTQTANLPVSHYAEFGEQLDMGQFMDYMQNNNMLGDPKSAYDRFVSSKREEKRTSAETQRQKEFEAQIAAAKEAALKEGIEKGRMEASMSKDRLPPDQGGPIPGMLPGVRERIQKARKEDGSIEVPEDMSAKDPALAALGAIALREGKLAPQVQ